MNILDHTRDISGRETHRLLSLYAAPDFVKNASHERLHGDPEKMARHLYADPYKKLYPCHSSAATWMSALWFAEKRAEFDAKTASMIEERIMSAANYFGIAGAVNDTTEKVAAAGVASLNALQDEDFAIVWRADSGMVERHWPLRNATEVKFAAEHFYKHRDEFIFTDRYKIANKILDKAVAYNADVSDAEGCLDTAAGRGICAVKVAADLLRERAQLVKRTHAELGDELVKLAELVEESPLESAREEFRLKLAAVVDQCDRDTKLYRMYDDGGLLRPEDVLFAVTEKVARDFMSGHVETTTGNVYDLADLEKLAVDDIRAALGDDFADAVSAGGVYTDRAKLAAIVPTLDRGMAATLDRLMSEKVAASVITSPEAEQGLLSMEALFDLAADEDDD